MTDRVDQLLEDILDGPAALERLLAAYDGRDSPLARLIPVLATSRPTAPAAELWRRTSAEER